MKSKKIKTRNKFRLGRLYSGKMLSKNIKNRKTLRRKIKTGKVITQENKNQEKNCWGNFALEYKNREKNYTGKYKSG